MTPCESLVHTALESARVDASRPLADARLTDRARLGVALQGVALLDHLDAARWRMDGGWSDAVVDAGGLLRGVRAVAGSPCRRPRLRAAELVTRLFGGDSRLIGRGAARAAARRLVDGWRLDLTGGLPGGAIGELLDEAPFLWHADLAMARSTLVAIHVHGSRRRPRVAGPAWFRRRVLARVASSTRLEAFLASEEATALWRRPSRPRTATGRARSALAELTERPGNGAAMRVELARCRFVLGQFDQALEGLNGIETEAALLLRASCLVWLGRAGAACRALERSVGAKRTAAGQLAVARVAVEAYARLGESAAAEPWVERAVASARGWLRPEADLLAAEAAAESGDLRGLTSSLRRSRIVLEQPRLAWRWYRAAAAGALARRRGETAVACYGRALAARRRELPTFEAARLWEGLARGRRLAGRLSAGERAAAHAARLHVMAGGPRPTRRCLLVLAEARLRLGRSTGVRALTEPARRRLEPGDVVALAARRDLVRGRPGAALERLSRADPMPDEGGERAALAARALGWMGHVRRARRMLSRVGPRGGDWFEPEERPALWALAGERKRAVAEVSGPAGRLWKRLLAGERAGAGEWADIDSLEGYRIARLVLDAELLAPGFCPAGRIDRAARELARAGAASLAARLEAIDRSAWQAVVDFLESGGGESELASLLAAVGAADARLWHEHADGVTVLVDGVGGGERLEAKRGGGRLVLSTRRAHPRLEALLHLVAERWTAPRRSQPVDRRGMIGESPVLRSALERSAAFAGTSLPVLIVGETGTGKELLARRVHALSDRSTGPFLPVNCAAVARDLLLSDLFGHTRGAFTGADRDRAGVFESARGGTVFLDEIGDLPLAAQGSLLRVLQEGEVRRLGESAPRRVDARVVAATHRDLAARVEAGTFRQDLFFRLAAATVELAPLRRRGDDVALLAEHFLRRLRPGATPTLSREGLARLRAHRWPGNVRELENALAVAAAVSGGGRIESEHLELGRLDGETPLGYHDRVTRYRRRLIEEALAASGGNRAAAARRIGLSRQAMSYLVRSLGIGAQAR